MKTQTKQLLALAVILVAALAVYVGLRLWNNGKEAQETVSDEGTALVELNTLTKLTFTTSDGETLYFEKSGEIWASGEEPELPLVQADVEAMVTALCALESRRTLEAHDALSDYGLNPAVRTVTGTDAGGNACTILLGNEIDYEGIYYAMVDGWDAVHVVSGDLFRATDCSLMDLAQTETLPEVTEENIQTVSLITDQGELTLCKQTEQIEELQERETGETDENGNPILEEVAMTVEVYHWTLAEGEEIPEGNETLSAVLDELSGLSFTDVCDFRPEEETLAGYALETVLRVECTDGTSFELALGAPDEEGTHCYARLGSSERIHRIQVSGVDDLLTMTAKTLTLAAQAE